MLPPYNSSGYNDASNSLFGHIIAGVGGDGAANMAASGVAGLALIPTVPLTTAALVGLNTGATIGAIQTGTSDDGPPPIP